MRSRRQLPLLPHTNRTAISPRGKNNAFFSSFHRRCFVSVKKLRIWRHQTLFVFSRFTSQQSATTWSKLATVRGDLFVRLLMWNVSIKRTLVSLFCCRQDVCTQDVLGDCSKIRIRNQRDTVTSHGKTGYLDKTFDFPEEMTSQRDVPTVPDNSLAAFVTNALPEGDVKALTFGDHKSEDPSTLGDNNNGDAKKHEFSSLIDVS